jgi:acetyl-CoA C-acetyltransferase
MRSVSVIGVGETKMGRHPGRTLRELVSEAGNKAIQDAGIEKSQLQALYLGNFNSSYFCLQSHTGPMVSEELGLGNIPTVRTEGACASGSLAFRQALMAIAAGYYDYVLVGGVEKMTHRQTEEITTGIASAADVEKEVNLGITFPSIFALMANRYSYEFGDARQAMAMCAVQNHEHGLLNPDAQMQKKVTIEQVLTGAPIAYPLTVFDCSLVTDGSAFLVLAATDIAKKMPGKRAIEVIGCGQAGDTLTAATKKSLIDLTATRLAAKQAYAMAGLEPNDIDFAEVHDCFTITQLLNIEDLGFFAKGTGAKATLEGKTHRDGLKPINVSGGLKAKGHPIGATGISQIFEIVTQLRGEAGPRQLKKAGIGLTHNLGGTAATCVVSVFRGVS